MRRPPLTLLSKNKRIIAQITRRGAIRFSASLLEDENEIQRVSRWLFRAKYYIFIATKQGLFKKF